MIAVTSRRVVVMPGDACADRLRCRMFDWFVAELRCRECGVVNPATPATNMQTHVRDDANGSELGVGTPLDPLDVRPDDILRSGYQLITQPKAGSAQLSGVPYSDISAENCVDLLREYLP